MTRKNNNTSSPIHTFVILAYKKSEFLESCIKSILTQSVESKIILATTTPTPFIKTLAEKYHLDLVIGKHTTIGGDFDFAWHQAATPLVTIAHQDDIYEKDYTKNIIKSFHSHSDSLIIFTDYYEIRGHAKVYSNSLLKIKRILLTPIRVKSSLKSTFSKRLIIRFGDSICCPSVTLMRERCPDIIFTSDLKCNVDWSAWELLSKTPGAFTFVDQPLMGHRISESSTTSKIINAGIRTKEDYLILKKFWPTWIARLITRFYARSEKSNNLNKT